MNLIIKNKSYLSFNKIILFIFVFGLSLTNLHAANKVGKVVFTKGIVTITNPGKATKILGRGTSLFVNDVINTADSSKAILKLIDGTQVSLIPNTKFIVKALSLKKNQEKADLHLLKGGLRAVTGLINKNQSGRFKLTTPVASIGIRGTDFTSYLCDKSCQDKQQNSQENTQKITGEKKDSLVKARILVIKGDVKAKNSKGKIRKLFKNSPIYEKETLITGKRSIAVLVFKDNTRTTVQANSEFLIEKFAYKPKKPKQNEASFKLVKGSLRFLTGKVGKLNRDKYVIKTPTSSIGIRGTGFDLSYKNPTYLFLWEGEVNFVYPNGQMLVGRGQSYFLANANSLPEAIKSIPKVFQTGPRPDSKKISEQVDLPAMFGTKESTGEVGLYIHVKEGEIEVNNKGEVLNLGKNETGFVGDKSSFRMTTAPTFLFKEFIPPNLDDKSLTRVNTLSELFEDKENGSETESGSICEVN